MSEKKKELLRTIKFTLFSVSAGLIQVGRSEEHTSELQSLC